MLKNDWASLAATPPMGWNSWNAFSNTVSEDVIKQTADSFVAKGLRDAGYRYIVIDDHWHGGRDADGTLYPDPVRFSHGMRSLADYVHARGLKFGIYSDAGERTCGGEPGSQDFEEKDARTFASWEVDFLKYDFCFAPDNRGTAERLFATMGNALKACGRPVYYNICEWGHHRPWLWAAQAGGHSWRVTGDIWDSWQDGLAAEQNGIDSIAFEQLRGLDAYSGPGHWNDPDMLIVGLHGTGTITGPGCSDTEYRTHFSLWCMLSAPLMIGCDLRNVDAVSLQTLTNPELIAIDQDALGRQGGRVCRLGRTEVWSKPLANGELAVGLFNRSDRSKTIIADWSDLEIKGQKLVRDLWQRQDKGVFEEKYTAEVESHGCKILRLSQA